MKPRPVVAIARAAVSVRGGYLGDMVVRIEGRDDGLGVGLGLEEELDRGGDGVGIGHIYR